MLHVYVHEREREKLLPNLPLADRGPLLDMVYSPLDLVTFFLAPILRGELVLEEEGTRDPVWSVMGQLGDRGSLYLASYS